MISRIKNRLAANRSLITVGIGVILFYLFLFAVGITCPIKHLTGISCPGCGMSRAWFHALTFRFAKAMEFHPVFWLIPIMAVFLWVQKKHPLIGRIALGICMGIVLLVYAVRMADPTDSIVMFAPDESLIYRIGHFLMTHISEWLKSKSILSLSILKHCLLI